MLAFYHATLPVIVLLAGVSAPSYEAVRDVVLTRTSEVSTLRAKYVLTQEHINGTTLEQHHEFRFDGQNVYDAEERIDVLKIGIPPLSIAATLGGIDTTYHGPSDNQPYHRKDGRIGGDNRDVRPYGSLMIPPDLWGDFPLDPLKQRYQKGEFSVREGPDGRTTLLHISPKGRRTDVILDEKLRIIRIAEGRLPEQYVVDKYLGDIPGASLFDDRLVCVTREIAINEFKSIDDVDFPISATRNTYNSTSGKILPGADKESILAFIEAWSAPGNREKQTVQELTVDVDSLEVNPTMSDADFKIEFPPGTRIQNEITGAEVRVGLPDPTQLVFDEKVDPIYPDPVKMAEVPAPRPLDGEALLGARTAEVRTGGATKYFWLVPLALLLLIPLYRFTIGRRSA